LGVRFISRHDPPGTIRDANGFDMQTVDQFLDQIDALPSAPKILPKLLSVLAEPDVDISRIVDLIAFDPGLTAKVLQLCNSAWLANSTPATDIGEAVSRLGIRCIYRLVAAVNGSRALRPSRPVPGLEPEALWKQSVIAALAAQFIAQDQNEDESVVFTSALLHHAGKVVLAQAFKDDYGRLLTECRAEPDGLIEQEQARFGVNHAEAGGRLLAKWQFPEPMVAGVAYYRHPSGAPQWQRQAATVNVADSLARILGEPAKGENGTPPASAEALSILKLAPEDLLRYKDRTLENFEFVNALCRL
jgi:HD-like signal output (HDOD) protein